MIDTSRLLPTLQLTGLAHKNQPLYQLLNQLIGIETKIAAIINATGGIGPVGPAGMDGKQGIPGNLLTLEEDIINFPIITPVFWQSFNGGIYYNAGFVGIGTSAPSTPLHVSVATNQLFRLENTGANGNAWGIEVVGTGASANGTLEIVDRTANIRRALFGTDGSISLGIGLGNDQSGNTFNIDSSGHVVIGAKTTAYPFEIDYAGGNNGTLAADLPGIKLTLTNGAQSSLMAITNTSNNLVLGVLSTNIPVIGTPNNTSLAFWTNNTEKVRIDNNGNLGIGQTTVTAYLHIKAGTAAANTAPIKLTSGTLLTTPEAGAIEFDGTDFFLTA